MLDRMMSDFEPLLRLQGNVNRLFQDFFDDSPAAGATRPYSRAYPPMNLWEDNDAAWIECELPGLGLDDLNVSVSANEVTIGGERRISEQNDASWHRRERPQGRFSRTLTVPWEIDADNVEAHLRDGVLTVKLIKAETAKPKKVKILGS